MAKEIKKQIHPYITQDTYELLKMAEKRQGMPLHMIVQTALNEYFNPEGRKSTEDIILRRLDRVIRDAGNTHLELAIIMELISQLAKNYFTFQPTVPEDQKEELLQISTKRHNHYLKLAAQNAAAGSKILEIIQQHAFLAPEEIPSELLRSDTKDQE